MAGIVTSNKVRRLVGNRLKEIDVPTTTLTTALYYADLTAQDASFTQSRVSAELNAYPVTVKNNASLALTPSANKTGVVYALNGDTNTLEEFEFQRGSSATYFDASGIMQLAAPNVPRINFENGVSKGLLIEPSSANLIPFSGMGNYGVFEAIFEGDRSRCSVVTESGKSSIKVIGGSSPFRLRPIAISENRYYTYSFWIKSSTPFTLRVLHYYVTTYSQSLHAVNNSWQRISITFFSNPGAPSDILHLYNAGGNFPEFYIADIQLEEGRIATSYIPTTTAVATRLADKVLSKRPTAVFPKNSIFVKTSEWPLGWLGNGVTDLNYSGRNLLKGSNSSDLMPPYLGSSITRYPNVAVSEWNALDASRLVITGGSNILKSVVNLGVPKNEEVVTASFWIKNNHTTDILIVASNQGGKTQTLSPGTAMRVIWDSIVGNGVGSVQLQLRTEDSSKTVDCTIWRVKYEIGNNATAWTPAPEDYVKVDNNGNIEISYTEPIHLQQFSLISRELKQEEI